MLKLDRTTSWRSHAIVHIFIQVISHSLNVSFILCVTYHE